MVHNRRITEQLDQSWKEWWIWAMPIKDKAYCSFLFLNKHTCYVTIENKRLTSKEQI
jgi:hypothetical protein